LKGKDVKKTRNGPESETLQTVEWSVFSKTTTRFFFGSTY
jgi:hypothetical protein